jgi:lipoate-protein ligase B
MELRVVDLGVDVPYAEGMARMRAAMERVDVDGPVVLLQEHAPVVTITRQGGTGWIHSSPEAVRAAGIELIETDRGGDVTFHGPGQLVGYPVLRLEPRAELEGLVDLGGYVRALEAALIAACGRLGVPCERREGKTGAWVGDEKLVAIGVGVRRGVTRHGFALNVSTELERFTDHIVPCGLEGLGVTSLERKLEVVPPMSEIKRVVIEEIERALSEINTQPAAA